MLIEMNSKSRWSSRATKRKTSKRCSKTSGETLAKEKDEHLSLMHWIRLQPNIAPYFIHIPNEGKRSPMYGSLLRFMGLKRGVSDFFYAYPCGAYSGLWIELKRKKLGVISQAQKTWIDLMLKVGYQAKVCYGWQDAVDCINIYLNGSKAA